MEEKKINVKEVKDNFDIKESALDCLKVIKGMFIKPIDTIKDFVQDSKYISGIIMILLTALATGIFKIAGLKRSYDSVNTGWFKAQSPEYLKEFFTTFGTNLVEYALVAVLGYLIISKCLKGKATLKQMISTVGISLTLVMLVYLVNSILVFIDSEAVGYIMGYLMTFATIYEYIVLCHAVNEVGKVDKNKLFLSVASMCVLATVVMDVFNKLFN